MAAHLKSRLALNTGGTVMIEFLFAFMPIFLIFLGTVQLVLLAAADLVVRHAAIVGARAACVVLSDDSRYYDGEALGTIAEDGGHEDTSPLRLLGDSRTPNGSHAPPTRMGRRPGPRLSAIRSALSLPLAALTPNAHTLQGLFESTQPPRRENTGEQPLLPIANPFVFYDALALAVTFPTAPGARTLYADAVPTRGDVTVRATYLFYCGVPLAAALVCARLQATKESTARGPATTQQGLQALEHAPNAASHAALSASWARFRILRAEATLPNHFAAYVVRDGREKHGP